MKKVKEIQYTGFKIGRGCSKKITRYINVYNIYIYVKMVDYGGQSHGGGKQKT